MQRLLVLLLLIELPGFALAEQPTFDAIDYATPGAYLELAESLGDRDRIAELGATLRGGDDETTIRNVLSWMDALQYDSNKAYAWRNFDDVVRERCYGSCADQSIVCAALLKGAGIPAVWVKTMDMNWIWDFKRGRQPQAWSGHVYLEVYVDGEWALLDPGAKMLYREYSPVARILPGNRFAYHKGNDPQQMILSLDWEAWKEQTRAYFADLDEGLLPVDGRAGKSLVRQAYVAGNDPYWRLLTDMAHRRGWEVPKSFNYGYDEHLPQARGHILLIETHGDQTVVPLDVLERFYPGASAGLQSPDGTIVIDGTTILFADFARLLDPVDK